MRAVCVYLNRDKKFSNSFPPLVGLRGSEKSGLKNEKRKKKKEKKESGERSWWSLTARQ